MSKLPTSSNFLNFLYNILAGNSGGFEENFRDCIESRPSNPTNENGDGDQIICFKERRKAQPPSGYGPDFGSTSSCMHARMDDVHIPRSKLWASIDTWHACVRAQHVVRTMPLHPLPGNVTPPVRPSVVSRCHTTRCAFEPSPRPLSPFPAPSL